VFELLPDVVARSPFDHSIGEFADAVNGMLFDTRTAIELKVCQGVTAATTSRIAAAFHTIPMSD
jgi:hypothetical protein